MAWTQAREWRMRPQWAGRFTQISIPPPSRAFTTSSVGASGRLSPRKWQYVTVTRGINQLRGPAEVNSHSGSSLAETGDSTSIRRPTWDGEQVRRGSPGIATDVGVVPRRGLAVLRKRLANSTSALP